MKEFNDAKIDILYLGADSDVLSDVLSKSVEVILPGDGDWLN